MANIMWSALVAEARGSIGGVTFSRGAGGAIARNRTRPINPRSNLQEIRRGNAAYIARYWSHTLTVDQRADWEAYTAGTSWTNKLGQSISIGANAAFLRLNTLLLILGEPVRDDAPTALGHAGGITIGFDAESDTKNIEFEEPGGAWDKDTDDDFILFFQALPVEGGRVRSTKGIRYIGSVEGDGTTAPTFPLDIDSEYSMQESQNVTIKAVHIDPDFRVSSAVFATEASAPSS